MIRSADGPPGSGNRGAERDCGRFDPRRARAARVRYLGRKSELKQALRGRSRRGDGERAQHAARGPGGGGRRAPGRARAAELDRRLTEESWTSRCRARRAARGHLHLITQIRREVEDVFLGLGYQVVDGREVETTHYNFDALNFPADHPARSPLPVGLPERRRPLPHRDLALADPRDGVAAAARSTWSPSAGSTGGTRPTRRTRPIFHQVEGLAVDRGITMADLKGTLLHMMRALFGEEREMRFRTHDFPFTEPSLEPDVSCFLCDGEGCPVCRYSGWIEIARLRAWSTRALFEFVGLDPEEWSGFAFGMGLERVAMLRHGLPALGLLWENDLRLLRQF